MTKMTADQFEERTGRRPVADELERVNCAMVGEAGHFGCGWCDDHGGPRFRCMCPTDGLGPPGFTERRAEARR